MGTHLDSNTIEFAPHPKQTRDQNWEKLLQAHQAGTFDQEWAKQHAPQSQNSDTHKFSSVQVDMPKHIAAGVQKIQAKIQHGDLSPEYGFHYGGASAADALENQSHVTALYGIHTTDPEEVKRVIAGEAPIKVTLGETSAFKNDEGDVLKVDIESPDLHRINAKLRELEHTSDFPTYIPHMTLAYLKPGSARDYVGDRSLVGKTAMIDTILFSGRDGNVTPIKLGGTAKPPTE